MAWRSWRGCGISGISAVAAAAKMAARWRSSGAALYQAAKWQWRHRGGAQVANSVGISLLAASLAKIIWAAKRSKSAWAKRPWRGAGGASWRGISALLGSELGALWKKIIRRCVTAIAK